MMATEIELAELERNWMRYKAERATGENGMLDPAEVDEVRRFRGGGMAETYAALQAARDGTYEGTAEGGRALLYAPGVAHLRAEQKGIGLCAAAMELSEGSCALADLAERYAREHGVDYARALIEVQRGGAQ
jgi:hypothetical protein